MSKTRWAIVIVGAALFAVYLLLPTQKDLALDFWTRTDAFDLADATDARLLINDKPVGGCRVRIELEKLREYFLPEPVPASWPPPETSPPDYDRAIGKSLKFDVRVQDGNRREGEKSHVVFVRVADGDDVLVGAFRVKVVNERGDTAVYAGSNLTEKSVEDKRLSATVQLQFHF